MSGCIQQVFILAKNGLVQKILILIS